MSPATSGGEKHVYNVHTSAHISRIPEHSTRELVVYKIHAPLQPGSQRKMAVLDRVFKLSTVWSERCVSIQDEDLLECYMLKKWVLLLTVVSSKSTEQLMKIYLLIYMGTRRTGCS